MITDSSRHLLYDEIILRADGGMLTEQALPTIYQGRAVQFLFADGVHTGREIYTRFDGVLSGPIRNGSRLETPVSQWERLVSRPHLAEALVVDRRPVPVGELAVPVSPFPVHFDDGQVGVLHLDCRFRAMLQCRDPRGMLDAYERGDFCSPEEEGSWALRTAAQEVLPSLGELLRAVPPMEAVGRVDGALAVDLARRIAARAEGLIPWMGVRSPELTLSVTNVDLLTQQSNRGYELAMEVRQKLIDAVLTVYTKDTFSPQIAQVLSGYVRCNPGISEEELVQLCGKLKSLSQHYSPQQILTTAVGLGLIPPANP